MQKKHKVDEVNKDHKRQWNIRWLVDDNGEPRRWLFYDKEHNLMFCTICTDIKSTFVVGSDNFKKSTVKCHEESKPHIRALQGETGELT